MIVGLWCCFAATTVGINAQVASAPTPAAAAPAQPMAAAAGKTVWDGVYTADQAAKGREVYTGICAECHSSGEAPASVGKNFLRRWYDDSLNVPFAFMKRAMPDNAPAP